MKNLSKHINTKADSKARESLFNLLDSTMQEPHIHYVKDGKDKRLKKFKTKDNKKDAYFYLLVTKDNDNIFITHLKTRDLSYLSKR